MHGDMEQNTARGDYARLVRLVGKSRRLILNVYQGNMTTKIETSIAIKRTRSDIGGYMFWRGFQKGKRLFSGLWRTGTMGVHINGTQGFEGSPRGHPDVSSLFR
jgi:hypothetical protein